jgi:hypothetical protein
MEKPKLKIQKTTLPPAQPSFNHVFQNTQDKPKNQIDLGRAFDQLKNRLIAAGVIALICFTVSCAGGHAYAGGPCSANKNMVGYGGK